MSTRENVHLRSTLIHFLVPMLLGGAAAAQTVTVTTSADVVDLVGPNPTLANLPGPDGVVSFREALLVTDNTPGHQTIGFAIPQEAWYLPTIFPGRCLLQGSLSWSASDSVTIDGSTQTAFTGNTFPDGNEVVLYGLPLYLGGDGSIVTGLHDSRVETFGSNAEVHGNTGGMYIVAAFGSGAYIHGNEADTIKLDRSNDNVVVGNTTSRVRIDGWFGGGQPATNNRVGGPNPADRNFITGWGNYGEHGVPGGTTVELFDTLDTLVQNNYIGTTPDGMSIGNAASTAGVGIYGQNEDLTIRDNLIAIRAVGVFPVAGVPYGQPIYIESYGGGKRIDILGNTLGLDASGEPLLGGVNGVLVSRYALEWAEDIRIGGTEPGEPNVIAGHDSYGLLLENGPGILPNDGVRISGNSIYANGAGAIDLTPNTWTFGPTANDPMDADQGANGLQNYPDLAAAVHAGSMIRVAGSLHSEPFNTYRLEFFASPTCHPSGFGQGQVFLGTTTVLTDGGGHAPFDAWMPAAVPHDWVVTSTATLEPVGATSEFSACVSLRPARVRESLLSPSSRL